MPYSNISSFISSRVSEDGSGALVNSMSLGRIEIDKNWMIQKVHDQSASILLGSPEGIEGKNFSRVLKEVVSKRHFMQLVPVLTSITRNESIINSTRLNNPFDCLKVCTQGPQGTEVCRHIRCEFSKDPNFEEHGRWRVVIRDISKAVRLSNNIRKNTEKTDLKVNSILSLLQFERELVQDFLDSTICSMREIIASLADDSSTYQEYKYRLESIYSIVHQIKGDASILNLEGVSGEAFLLENHLSRLNAKIKLTKEDFACLHKPLSTVINSVKDVKDIFECIVEGGWSHQKSVGGGDGLLKQLDQLVQNVAKEKNKRVIIVDDGYQDSTVPLHLQRVVGKVVAQLARNAVSHGIEDVKTRIDKMKTPYGCIHISVRLLRDHFVLTVRDDGRGIDSEAIRKAAMKSKLFDSSAVLKWNKTQLLSALFKSGFSTAVDASAFSGRGAGLDIVKTSVEEHGGRIGIKSSLGQFTEFTMAFPRQSF